MSERADSDVIFRDLSPKAAPDPRSPEDEEWEKRLREELRKLRPQRAAPRVVPAAEAAANEPRFETARRKPRGSAPKQQP
jgi:hypothetical protein